MGPSPFDDASIFLIRTLFELYVFVVMLRFLLQLTRADFYNPISQFVVRATRVSLRPLQQVLPRVYNVDTAALVLMLALECVKILLLTGMYGHMPPLATTLVLAMADIARLLLNVLFWAVVIRVVMSWVNPGAHNPVNSLVGSLTEPMLNRTRRILPPMSGFDLSPIPVLMVLQLAQILVVAPLRSLAGL